MKPEKDVVQEGKQLVEEAERRGITLRLLGGIAFRLRCPSALEEGLKRRYVDVDFVGLRQQRKQIEQIFSERGYAPRVTFNAMNGFRRLIFNDLDNGRRADIFLNVFEMSHKFDFTDRLKLDRPTLPLADLLLTKLQVYEITEREYKDVIALLTDHALGTTDSPELINKNYIARLCSDDWGLWKTVSINIDRISSSLEKYISVADRQVLVKSRLDELWKTIEDEPKSLRWKLRARVGEKVRWYELPEADKEIIDSRPSDGKTPQAERQLSPSQTP